MSIYLESNTYGNASDSSEHDGSCSDWPNPLSDPRLETEKDGQGETWTTESGLNAVKDVETTVSNVECNTKKNPFTALSVVKRDIVTHT